MLSAPVLDPIGAAGLFNMPFTPPETGGSVYADIIGTFAEGRALDVVEIGVFQGRLLTHTKRRHPGAVKSWVGVDPYLGDENDPYFKSYWKGQKSAAEKQFEETKAKFEALGGELWRGFSDDFFKQNQSTFDVVIVDGDHRKEPALRDLRNGLSRLRPGGLLVCDDYGNSDTPEVARAVVQFAAESGDWYDASGFRPVWFMNAGKPFPIMLSVIYWRKKA